MAKANTNYAKLTRNPLGQHIKTLQTHCKIQPAHIEHRYPHVTTPWWKPLQVTTDSTSEEAIAQYRLIYIREDATYVYTDGSGIEGHTGAAAVILLAPSSQNSPILRKHIHYMGRDTENMVYAAELKGISLALQIIQNSSNTLHNKVVIFTNSQSALKWYTNLRTHQDSIFWSTSHRRELGRMIRT
jgi:hypothetical protein